MQQTTGARYLETDVIYSKCFKLISFNMENINCVLPCLSCADKLCKQTLEIDLDPKCFVLLVSLKLCIETGYF